MCFYRVMLTLFDFEVKSVLKKNMIFGKYRIPGRGFFVLSLALVMSLLTPDNARAELPSIASAGAGKVLDEVFRLFDTRTMTEDDLGAGAGDFNHLDVSVNVVEEDDGTFAGYKNLGVAHVDNHLNIREEADENSELVGKMTKNAGCEILSISGNWAHIKSGKVEGYCKTEFLYTGEEAIKVGMEAMTLMATVNTTTLFVRENPDKESAVMTMIPMGEEYEVLEGEDGDAWVKIAVDEDEGWISTEFIKMGEKLDQAMSLTELKYGQGISDVRVSLCNYAKQFLGNRYVWGGTSLTNGCDCSGYVQSLFRKYNVYLPRTSAAQSTVGTKIDPSQAQPGDLFFYAKYGRINHVALYIGGGMVINAASRRLGIRINSAYYRKPAVVRRVLD
ncbi:MAG: C40 family peptidase [Lachnospiraceae bacterium]|nr:C40 family peptidase [Lachnospiraceae bacterium]